MNITKRPHSFKYLFSNENRYIGELKYEDVGVDAPKAEKYAWFYHNAGHTRFLKFISMTRTTRLFEEGFLELGDTNCVFTGMKDIEGKYIVYK